MLGVIPAGGRATRFAGVYKDLLPVGDDAFLLSDAVERAVLMGCDRITVVTSAEKAAAHERFLRAQVPDVPTILIVSSDLGLWEAVRTTLHFASDSLLILADTIFTVVAPPPSVDLAFGVFQTDEPHRFSILMRDTIVTKPVDCLVPQIAWGCVRWSRAVADFWRGRVYAQYDDAFRDAMTQFGYVTFPIVDYHDLGTWDAYRQFLTRCERPV